MNWRPAVPWLVGGLAVAALALGGVFANLAVLQSGQADAAIGTLSARAIQGGSTWTAPVVVPMGAPPLMHRDDRGHPDGDD